MPSIIHFHDKCIGCNICYEMWPVRWRMSKTDGKAVLIGGIRKKQVFVATIPKSELEINTQIAKICPAKVIKIQ